MNMESPQERKVEKPYAADYEQRPKELVAKMKDAEDLLNKIKHNPTLRPEAIAKVMNEQTAIFLAARTELEKIQKENEEEITRNIPKEKPPH